jgi:transposase
VVVSEPERLILDALVISPDLPKIQDRASVVLKAGDGLADEEIAASLKMRRKDVLHWRKRFEAHGIRGLWDENGPGTGRHMTREKEQAILWDLLYDMWGLAGILNLNNKLVAQTHHVSRHAVNRICAKHGIVRDKFSRVDIDRLKIFQDPLFGVTVSGIAGLFSSTVGVLALRSSDGSSEEIVG